MKRRGLQLGQRHRLILHITGLLLFISGAVWAWAARVGDTGKAAEYLRHIKPWFLEIHGLSAMFFVFLLGTVFAGHMLRAWHARKNRGNGLIFILALSLLTISGYLLYYLGDEAWRNLASRFHLWLGLAAPVLMAWHIHAGHKATKNSSHSISQ